MDLQNLSWLTLKFLVACSMKSAFFLLLAWLAEKCLRNYSAALRHRMWATVIVSSLVLPWFTLLLPRWRATSLAATSELWGKPLTGSKATFDNLPAMLVDARLDS